MYCRQPPCSSRKPWSGLWSCECHFPSSSKPAAAGAICRNIVPHSLKTRLYVGGLKVMDIEWHQPVQSLLEALRRQTAGVWS
jgi:hypothetical protein